jgi:hypothetical protein
MHEERARFWRNCLLRNFLNKGLPNKETSRFR